MLAVPRAKSTKVLVGFRINAKLLERLEAIADRLGRNRSELFDRAVEEYVERVESEQKEHSPAPTKSRK